MTLPWGHRCVGAREVRHREAQGLPQQFRVIRFDAYLSTERQRDAEFVHPLSPQPIAARTLLQRECCWQNWVLRGTWRLGTDAERWARAHTRRSCPRNPRARPACWLTDRQPLEVRLPAGGYSCPASTIFAGWHQSVLPVHLLGLAPLLGSVGPVAGDVKLQDDGVMDHPVNRRGGGHRVGKDAFPLREDQV